MVLAKKLLSLLLAVVGLALTAVGIWFTAHLGTSGIATFRVSPSGSGPVVLEPSLLNRLDENVAISVTPAAGSKVWLAVGAPSDVTSAIAETPRTRLTGVAVRDWALLATRSGSGTTADLTRAEIWREQLTSVGRVDLTVDQRSAPQTVVVSGQPGQVSTVQVSWQRGTWFAQALVVALVGLMITAAGVVSLVALFRRRREVTT